MGRFPVYYLATTSIKIKSKGLGCFSSDVLQAYSKIGKVISFEEPITVTIEY